MDKIITKFGIGLALMIALSAHAQWGSSPGMMPWGGQSFMQPQAQQPFSGGMPWGSGEQRYNQPRYTQGSIMPWGQSRTPAYQAPQAQSFGGMMPFGNMAQPQSRYRQPPRHGSRDTYHDGARKNYGRRGNSRSIYETNLALISLEFFVVYQPQCI